MMVIYAIVNLKNSKKYVGSAVNFSSRKTRHLFELKKNDHHSLSLQQSWNKNSPQDYIFIVLEKVSDRSILYEREQYWMDYYKSYDKKYGYNMTKTSIHPDGHNIKPVYQFNLNGEFIKKFDNCCDAASEVGCSSSGLSKCARERYRFYCGYIWSYKENLSKERVTLANNPIKKSNETKLKMSIKAFARTNQRKPILQYDKNGNFIKEWRCTSDVSRELGYSNGSISDTLHGKHKHSYGFIWKFKDEQNE